MPTYAIPGRQSAAALRRQSAAMSRQGSNYNPGSLTMGAPYSSSTRDATGDRGGEEIPGRIGAVNYRAIGGLQNFLDNSGGRGAAYLRNMGIMPSLGGVPMDIDQQIRYDSYSEPAGGRAGAGWTPQGDPRFGGANPATTPASRVRDATTGQWYQDTGGGYQNNVGQWAANQAAGMNWWENNPNNQNFRTFAGGGAGGPGGPGGPTGGGGGGGFAMPTVSGGGVAAPRTSALTPGGPFSNLRGFSLYGEGRGAGGGAGAGYVGAATPRPGPTSGLGLEGQGEDAWARLIASGGSVLSPEAEARLANQATDPIARGANDAIEQARLDAIRRGDTSGSSIGSREDQIRAQSAAGQSQARFGVQTGLRQEAANRLMQALGGAGGFLGQQFGRLSDQERAQMLLGQLQAQQGTGNLNMILGL